MDLTDIKGTNKR